MWFVSEFPVSCLDELHPTVFSDFCQTTTAHAGVSHVVGVVLYESKHSHIFAVHEAFWLILAFIALLNVRTNLSESLNTPENVDQEFDRIVEFSHDSTIPEDIVTTD